MSEKKFIININEVDEDGNETPRYMQTVDHMDIHAVINAVNSVTQQQPQRQRALRSDAGKPRVNKVPDDDITSTPVVGFK